MCFVNPVRESRKNFVLSIDELQIKFGGAKVSQTLTINSNQNSEKQRNMLTHVVTNEVSAIHIFKLL